MELAERKALRAQLTRQVNTAKDLLAEDLNTEELSAVLSCLKLTNEKLNAVSKKVVSSAEEENLEDEFEKMLEYEEKAVATIARLEHRISAADPFSDRGSSAHQLIKRQARRMTSTLQVKIFAKSGNQRRSIKRVTLIISTGTR